MSHSFDNDGARLTLEESLGPSAKIWSAYVSETEKQDRTLAQDCQRDMDAILIFTGLFSASLTAFIIESYKNLKPEPDNATVRLLKLISHQLSTPLNASSSFPAPTLSATSFQPPTSALICNLFWFLSLGFSLACALTATLAEQWARNYLQATENRSVPSERARVRAYLYRGIERFRMRAVVDIVPMLLHASLFLFFAGLVLFLIPVNRPLAIVTFAILTVSVTLYICGTLLPVVFSDCPYRTPLSPWCWRGLEALRKLRYRRFPSNQSLYPSNMAQESASDATRRSTDRAIRDLTVLSLTAQLLETNGRLSDFVNCHDPSSPVDNRDLTTMLFHTDLSKRLGRILKSYELCHPDEKAQRIPATLKAIGTVAGVWTKSHYGGNKNTGHIYFGAKLLADLCSAGVIDNSDRVLRRNTSFRVLWPLLSEFIALAKELNELLVELVKPSLGGSPPVNVVTGFLDRGCLQTRMANMSCELATLWGDLRAGNLKPLLSHYPSIIDIESLWPLYANLMRILQLPQYSPPLCPNAIRYALEQSRLLHASLSDSQLFLLLDSLEAYSPMSTSEACIDWGECVAQLSRCPISTLAQERLLFVLMKYNEEFTAERRQKDHNEVYPSMLLRGLIRDPGLIEATPRDWRVESKLVLVRGGHIVRYG